MRRRGRDPPYPWLAVDHERRDVEVAEQRIEGRDVVREHRLEASERLVGVAGKVGGERQGLGGRGVTGAGDVAAEGRGLDRDVDPP